MSNQRTAWILGAGFSQALGAPLFKDLFQNEQRLLTSGLALPDRVYGVLNLYREYGPDADTAGGKGRLWRDPEEFLDVIETAKAPSGDRRLLEGIYARPPNTVEELADLARRVLAVECSLFLRGNDPSMEKWIPYRRWAPRLSREHTIVTFNYDRVFERLKEKRPIEAKNYRVVVPNGTAAQEINDARLSGCAPVLKLHGSVDWVATNGKIRSDSSENLLGALKTGEELVLGVPGPDKIGVRDRFPEITVLWNAAKEAIKQAERVVFIGYRFPQTDAEARTAILQALLEASGIGLVKVEIVLGPDEKHPDVARMVKLLRYVCPERVQVTALPLYGEDFLSLVDIAPNLM
jgi:SIR2-like domain